MKKILLAAVAALAIVGCSQNEEIEKAGEKAEINFGTIVSKTTRAAITDNAALQGMGFTVYAYNTGAKTVGEGGLGVLDKVFMPGVTVEYSNGAWGITGNTTYYWPLDDNIQFFAYATDASATGYKAESTASYPKIDYTVADLAANQKDFVVAQALNQTQANPKVTFTFTHVLTQVNFSANTDTDLTYSITSVKLTGISKTGTYNFADSTWVAKTGEGNITEYAYLEKSEGVSVVKDEKPTDLQQNGALMLIPQSLADAKIVISYDVLQGGEVIKKANEEISLATTAWEAGKNIRYTLNLAATGATVSFDTTVGAWGTEASLNSLTPAE